MTENDLIRRIDALSMENASLAVRVAKLEAENAIKVRQTGPSHAGCSARPWDREEDRRAPEGGQGVREGRPGQEAQWEAALARLRDFRERRTRGLYMPPD